LSFVRISAKIIIWYKKAIKIFLWTIVKFPHLWVRSSFLPWFHFAMLWRHLSPRTPWLSSLLLKPCGQYHSEMAFHLSQFGLSRFWQQRKQEEKWLGSVIATKLSASWLWLPILVAEVSRQLRESNKDCRESVRLTLVTWKTWLFHLKLKCNVNKHHFRHRKLMKKQLFLRNNCVWLVIKFIEWY